MTVSQLVYTSSVQASARRAAAAERRAVAEARRVAAAERELERKLPGMTAQVREEGEWFNVKVYDNDGKWRGQGFSAESVARMLLDPETDVEYWPAAE